MTKKYEDVRQEIADAKRELAVGIKKEEETNRDTKILKLNGVDVEFNFGELRGKDILEIKDRYKELKKGRGALLEELDDTYYMLVAERVSGMDFETLINLPYKQYNLVKNTVRDFLQQD